jgi:hypothetical protein
LGSYCTPETAFWHCNDMTDHFSSATSWCNDPTGHFLSAKTTPLG